MSNMKGRIARTIEAVLRHPPILALDMEGRVSSDWIAHEVLVAMREPTEEMVNAVRATVETSDTHIDLSYKAKEVWCEMIDAALKD